MTKYLVLLLSLVTLQSYGMEFMQSLRNELTAIITANIQQLPENELLELASEYHNKLSRDSGNIVTIIRVSKNQPTQLQELLQKINNNPGFSDEFKLKLEKILKLRGI